MGKLQVLRSEFRKFRVFKILNFHPCIAHMLLFLEHGSKSRCWCKCTESILSNEEPQYGAVFKGVSSYQYLPSGECQLYGVRVHLPIHWVRHCRNTLTASRRIPSNELVSILSILIFFKFVLKCHYHTIKLHASYHGNLSLTDKQLQTAIKYFFDMKTKKWRFKLICKS